MKTKILIIEDELLIAENHKDKLLSFGIEEVKIALSEVEALAKLKNFTPDLVLLDVRLKKAFEGIELGEKIQQNMNIPVVFITAHSDMVTLQKILSVEPAAYLSKPIRSSDLQSAITIALRNKIEPSSKEQVVINKGGEKICFPQDDFLFAQSSGNYINLHVHNRKRQVVRMTLEQLLNITEQAPYCRINRSVIVNLKNVSLVKNKKLFIDELEFSISPKFADAFHEAFAQMSNQPV